MRRSGWQAMLLALGMAACSLPDAPVWAVDFFFPIDFPDIDLNDYAVAGEIPPIDVTLASTPQTQDITGLLEEFLSDDLNALAAEVVTGVPVDITGTLAVVIATSPTRLAFPDSSITVQIAVAQGTDTTRVDVDPALVRNAIALYYQARGTLRGSGAGTPVGPGDRIRLDVNLLANYQVSR
ncbi:MAG: hypothetical protein OER21_12125 [Gemmatimonadota bacterium]|nr:hypothetical protein [Gemmatimonadota bacterium]